MLDRFPESGTENIPEYESLHKAWKHITIFVIFFAYLPSNRSTSFALKRSYYQSEVWVRFVSHYDAYT